MKISLTQLRGLISEAITEALDDPPPPERTDKPKFRGTFKGQQVRSMNVAPVFGGRRPQVDRETGETVFIPYKKRVPHVWEWDGNDWVWREEGAEQRDRLAAAQARAAKLPKPVPMSDADRQAQIDAFLAKKGSTRLKESRDKSLLRGLKALKDRAVMAAGDDDLDKAEADAYRDLAAALDDVAKAFSTDVKGS